MSEEKRDVTVWFVFMKLMSLDKIDEAFRESV